MATVDELRALLEGKEGSSEVSINIVEPKFQIVIAEPAKEVEQEVTPEVASSDAEVVANAPEVTTEAVADAPVSE